MDVCQQCVKLAISGLIHMPSTKSRSIRKLCDQNATTTTATEINKIREKPKMLMRVPIDRLIVSSSDCFCVAPAQRFSWMRVELLPAWPGRAEASDTIRIVRRSLAQRMPSLAVAAATPFGAKQRQHAK